MTKTIVIHWEPDENGQLVPREDDTKALAEDIFGPEENDSDQEQEKVTSDH
jgi:hypothetical protein